MEIALGFNSLELRGQDGGMTLGVMVTWRLLVIIPFRHNYPNLSSFVHISHVLGAITLPLH